MKYEITIKEACEGVWKCLEPSDWIQLASVMIAMFAAIASYVTVVQQKKQFQVANEERKMRYRPIFKINFFSKNSPTRYIFDIVNEGFAYFVTKEVNWIGEGNIRADFFNGRVGNDTEGRHESLVVLLDFPENANAKGHFEIIGYDIENNKIKFKSPEIIFKDGKIENHLKLSLKYLE
ncbi:hypothetical protein B6A27_00310 [Anoxybacillus sp. UARK-01]|uniref:hypothetical protein n=1 Tax=Anoxybacillus sp. UARK-01 TaxID=1895648 RepID=UPI0009B9B056|nr:hypothetical protein [Anoxybacillus sp. UARK-01]OQM47522.1 hypothetical protein B6A27_00310 [Anoxybacillus sp. UARK-01]